MRVGNDNREGVTMKKEQLELEKENLEKDYLSISRDYLPFLLTKNIFEDLQIQLEKEDEFLRHQATQEAVEPKIDNIISEIFDNEPEDVRLKPNQKRYFESQIDRVIRKFLLDGKVSDFFEEVNLIHNLSPTDKNKNYPIF
ncbi:MAG: hypothetical protein HC912_03110 [Saprospiraceae bacterium]|nr:hypothetical protein [Saprospiraceae bacterium]